MRGQPASSYPSFTCTDQKAAHTVAEQARTQAVNGATTPLVVDLTNAMVQRYLPQVVCNTTTLRNAELEFAQQLAYIAHRHQVCGVRPCYAGLRFIALSAVTVHFETYSCQTSIIVSPLTNSRGGSQRTVQKFHRRSCS